LPVKARCDEHSKEKERKSRSARAVVDVRNDRHIADV
jgi:hypothetical protein